MSAAFKEVAGTGLALLLFGVVVCVLEARPWRPAGARRVGLPVSIRKHYRNGRWQ